jgi:8-oxo-dGTP diphosphatase
MDRLRAAQGRRGCPRGVRGSVAPRPSREWTIAGSWNLPAGYVENDEPPSEAARREAREEVGIEIVVDGLHGVYYFADDPRGNGILIVYECSPAHGEPRCSAETTEVAYFRCDAVPADLAGAGHDQAIHDWVGRIT